MFMFMNGALMLLSHLIVWLSGCFSFLWNSEVFSLICVLLIQGMGLFIFFSFVINISFLLYLYTVDQLIIAHLVP